MSHYYQQSDRRLHRVITLFNDNEWDYLLRYQQLMNYPTLSRAIRAAVWNQFLHHRPKTPPPKQRALKNPSEEV